MVQLGIAHNLLCVLKVFPLVSYIQEYHKQRHVCVCDCSEMDTDPRKTRREKTVSLELSANPFFPPVMWFPTESIAPLAHRQSRLFTLDPAFPSFSPSFAFTHSFLLPLSCESSRISVLRYNLLDKVTKKFILVLYSCHPISFISTTLPCFSCFIFTHILPFFLYQEQQLLFLIMISPKYFYWWKIFTLGQPQRYLSIIHWSSALWDRPVGSEVEINSFNRVTTTTHTMKHILT